MGLDITWAVDWVRRSADVISEHRVELITLDREIGDGDHGENMDRGFQAVLPKLDELGVNVAESAIVDQTAEDVAATDNSTEVIAERFDAAGVDQVIVLGTSSLAFVQGIAPTDYRPEIRFTEAGAVQTSGQPLIFRSSIWRCVVRKPPPESEIPAFFASSTMRL